MTAIPSPPIAGSCHCGHVKFTVVINTYEAVRCNCSICTMKGYLHYFALPGEFNLKTPKDHLSTYRFGTKIAAHTFCKHCGVAPFYTPRSHPNHVDVNVNCLPKDIINQFTVTDFDGENWTDNIQSLRSEHPS